MNSHNCTKPSNATSNQEDAGVTNKKASVGRSHRSAGRVHNRSYQKQSSLATHRHQQQQQQLQQQQQNKDKSNKSTTSRADGSAANGPNSTAADKSSACVTLDDFAKHARIIKTDILQTLERQTKKKESEPGPNHDDQIANLKQNIENITRLHLGTDPDQAQISSNPTTESDTMLAVQGSSTVVTNNCDPQKVVKTNSKVMQDPPGSSLGAVKADGHGNAIASDALNFSCPSEQSQNTSPSDTIIENNTNDSPDKLSSSVDRITIKEANHTNDKQVPSTGPPTGLEKTNKMPIKSIFLRNTHGSKPNSTNNCTIVDSSKSKKDEDNPTLNLESFGDSALVDDIEKHLSNMKRKTDDPRDLESICMCLLKLNNQNSQLMSTCSKLSNDNQKLTSVKQKLENLCRELQKSNTTIRIENLNLIKEEQGRSREMTKKFQSTLNDLIRLFEENQQRNLSLRQENQDLQTRLKSLVEHCENWEKSVDTTLRQRDIENRLIKTELAKANLLKNEEKEKFLTEKSELLQILSMMQEQQQRIEGQEAKLRLDLSSYASKYDECQAVISKGMNKFQTESKKMLKQIERSKQDYKILLSKYELSNKRMSQLLEEKQRWDGEMLAANKKIETLEKLCRALQGRKATGDSDDTNKDDKSIPVTLKTAPPSSSEPCQEQKSASTN